MKKHANSSGFTLVELLIVIAIMGILASMAIPQYLKYIERAHATACLVERNNTDKMITLYYNENPDTSLTNLPQLVDTGYMDSEPQCPYGGEYVLIPADENHDHPRVGCSLHYWPDENKPLTSLGSTFEEISGSMITIVKEFYDKNGRYPRSWGDYAYTDIGLERTDWTTAYNGIIYSPVGKRIKVTPEEGYIFYVTRSDGKEKKLKSNYNWSLWYSMEDGKWYYHKIKAKNEIDISTLRVEMDS